MNDFFHRGIASGEGFCNRVEELDRLIKNIHKGTHTLLISPRRYGKTSLALRAIESIKLPYASIDLFMKSDETSIVTEFLSGMSHLISKLVKPTELALKKVESLLKNITISMKLGKFGFEFQLTPQTIDNKKNLKSLLVGVDELLIKYNKRAIIFIDEIQAISGSPFCNEVESSLRFVAQKTKNISFIFSGSSRHLLNHIFNDRSRPLYKLCHTMTIQRISQNHYKSFINKLAIATWKKSFSEDALQEIFSSTRLHSYYMNILCGYLFEQVHLPTEQDVIQYWEKICREEQGSIANDIAFLTTKQKHLLQEIAKHPRLKEPTSKEFVKKVNLTPKGILGAIEILQKHDFIERTENGEIYLVDPVLEYWSSR